jgi:hypothetical protein
MERVKKLSMTQLMDLQHDLSIVKWQTQDENGDLILSTRIRRDIREYLPGLIDVSDEWSHIIPRGRG